MDQATSSCKHVLSVIVHICERDSISLPACSRYYTHVQRAASKMERPTFPRNDTDHTDKKAAVGMSKVASIGVGEVGEVSERLISGQVSHVLITGGTDLCADRFAARQLSGRYSSPVPT